MIYNVHITVFYYRSTYVHSGFKLGYSVLQSIYCEDKSYIFFLFVRRVKRWQHSLCGPMSSWTSTSEPTNPCVVQHGLATTCSSTGDYHVIHPADRVSIKYNLTALMDKKSDGTLWTNVYNTYCLSTSVYVHQRKIAYDDMDFGMFCIFV